MKAELFFLKKARIARPNVKTLENKRFVYIQKIHDMLFRVKANNGAPLPVQLCWYVPYANNSFSFARHSGGKLMVEIGAKLNHVSLFLGP